MSTGMMIAYLPADPNPAWCLQDLPHMTLVYAGQSEDHPPSFFNELTKEALTVARQFGGFVLDVTGIEEYGEGADAVDVLELYPTPQLLMARRVVEKYNASSYKDFKPHATIGPAGSANQLSSIPSRIAFHTLGVFDGTRKITFDSMW